MHRYATKDSGGKHLVCSGMNGNICEKHCQRQNTYVNATEKFTDTAIGHCVEGGDTFTCVCEGQTHSFVNYLFTALYANCAALVQPSSIVGHCWQRSRDIVTVGWVTVTSRIIR